MGGYHSIFISCLVMLTGVSIYRGPLWIKIGSLMIVIAVLVRVLEPFISPGEVNYFSSPIMDFGYILHSFADRIRCSHIKRLGLRKGKFGFLLLYLWEL